MYCPKCKVEYREGFTVCADCNVSLVNELPPEPTETPLECVDFEELIRIRDPLHLSLVKDLLQSANIPFLTKDTFLGALYTKELEVVFCVPKDKLKESEVLLTDFFEEYIDK